MSYEFSEEEVNDIRKEVDRVLWLMVKNEHISMGVDSSGEFIFWSTEENHAKFQKERHLYEEA